MTRKEQREWLVRMAYEQDINNRNFRTAADLLKSHNLPEDSQYMITSINTYHHKIGRIDEIISSYLVDMPMSRLKALDKAILRVAVNEIVFTALAPMPVSINEAVELTKEYSDEPAYKFVNGILASLARDINDGLYDSERKVYIE